MWLMCIIRYGIAKAFLGLMSCICRTPPLLDMTCLLLASAQFIADFPHLQIFADFFLLMSHIILLLHSLLMYAEFDVYVLI